LQTIKGWKMHELPHPFFSGLAEKDLAENNASMALTGSDTVNG
jgi:hypothetical protein